MTKQVGRCYLMKNLECEEQNVESDPKPDG